MSLSTVTLKWNITDLLQSGLSATLSITPTAQLSDSTDHELIPSTARTYSFTGGQGQLAGIVANDNTAILPAGTGYLISVTAANGQVIVPQFQTQLLFANGAIQWLDALAPVPVVATSYQYLPLPSGPPSAGQVPVATGTGEASAWGPGGGGGGSGTVTTMSVVSANGLAGTVANPTTTPAVTLSTSVTGVLKGNGTAISAATPGTDYLPPNGSGAALTGITAAQVGADASGAAAGVQALAALKASNLSDLASASTARTNLGLGSAALLASSAVAQTANNLSDLASATTARTNLGLGTAATQASSTFDAAGAASSVASTIAAEIGAANGIASLDSGTHVPTAQLPTATTSTQGAVVIDGTAADIQPAGVATAGAKGQAADAKHVHPYQPWQFLPEAYGALGDMRIAHDLAITSGQPTLTTVGVANPTTAPTLATAATGGTILAGTYQVKYTYASATGETLASSSAPITTTGSTSTITVTPPAVNGVPGGAVGWNAYITAAGGSTFFKQMTVTSPWPFPNTFTIFAPPVTTTAQPPVANTTTSSPWASMVAGQAIRVIGAGAAGADLRTTILSVGGSSATLNANAGTTVSASGAVWGTDDTAAVQSAINAAAAYTVANNRTGEVLLSKLYLSNTAPTVGGTYAGNCVLQLPSIANGSPKVRVSIIGVSKDVSTLLTYQQMIPEMSGTGIIYIGPNGTNDANYGPAHVFGTPTLTSIFVTESGVIPGTTNIKVMMDSVRVVVPFAAGIGGIDLFSAAQSANYNCNAQALGIVPSGGSWTHIPANGPTVNQWGWGLREPGPGNNAVSYTEQFTATGLCYGYGPSEHVVFVDVFAIYCVTGIEGFSNNITMVHNAHGISAGVEFCTNAVGALDGLVRIDIDNLRTESIGGKIVFDTSNRLQGTIYLRDQGASGQYKTGYFTGGSGVRLISLMTQPGPIAAPNQPVAAGGTAWFDFYYRDAWIEANASGGTFTSLTITGQGGTAVAQPGAAGASSYRFLLPSGCSYTPVLSAGTVTHTVTLL